MKHRYSVFFYNTVSYCGVALALVVFIIECFLFGLDFLDKGANVYLGIITYILLPPFLILGLILIPVGAVIKKRRIAKGLAEAAPKKIQIDFSLATHRNAAMVFVIVTSILIIMTAIGSYKAYTYTESVQFCGVTCHNVMIPQYTAYLHSPHARVKCVECHIGEGPDWYIHYKLAGARQLYHFLQGRYPKPIPTPVHNLRPPTDTCQHCHWPNQFYGASEIRRTYYSASDEKVKPWNLRMLIRVGGDQTRVEGIHSHMNIDHDIYYAAEDEQRQKITWVKSVAKDGTASVFTTADSKYRATAPADHLVRKMDCLDCHNRPTHHFNAPYVLLNAALNQGKISIEIPNIKSKIMELISASYATTEDAVAEITRKLSEYYRTEHSAFFKDNKPAIDQAVDQAVEMYKNNFFPEMKTRWDNRLDNIGHMWAPGCFRCHDGNHTSDSGKVITKDCNACHTIIEQGAPGAEATSTAGLEFIHPFEDDGLWKEMNCFDCHTGS